jgi:ABC-type sugar transport system permease subunit
MADSNLLFSLLRVILLFIGVVISLFIGLTMLRRSAEISKGKGWVIKLLTRMIGLVYIGSLILFLLIPRLAVIPAASAVVGSIVLGIVLMKKFSMKLTEKELGLFFLLPAFLGVLALYYYPITQTFVYSLHEMKYSSNWLESTFTGLNNFISAFKTANFRRSFAFTAYFTFATVLLCFLIGLSMALVSYWVSRRWRGLLRAVIVIPWAVPPILTAAIWRWLLNADVGPFAILHQWGWIKEVPVFLSEPVWAMHSVIFADAWKWSPFVAIFLIGALSTIPEELYDAAKVDGAGAFIRFTRITLPMIAPTIFVALLFRTMEALRVFDIVYGMTGGGPGTVTETLSTFSYKYYFSYSDFGMGSAYAIVVFIIIFGLSLLYVSRIYKNLRFR